MGFLKDMNKYTRAVTMPGGYKHNLPDTLREIDRHWVGQFQSGNTDSQGKYKYWMHTSRPLCEMASKNVDVNTSMIKLIGVPLQSELSTWAMERELRVWLIENGFDSFLNDLVENYPKFGHIVVKVHKRVGKSTGVSLVPIENLRMDPSCKWLKHSGFVGELHRMTQAEILRHKDWDPKEVQRLFKLEKSDYDVYEYYSMQEEGYKRIWYAWIIRPNASTGGTTFGIEANINQPDNMSFPPIKLYEEEIDELPYRELKWSDVAGRWLGEGEMEYLRDNQYHDNETGYLELKSLYLKALRIFTTTDDSLGGNVIREMVTGQVVKTPGELKMVTSDNTDLSAFQQNNQRWDKNASSKSFNFDPTGVGSGKSNKQLIAWMQENTASYFKKKQENLGIFLRELLYYDILPSFKNDKKKKHMFTFVGSYADIDQFTKFIVESHINAAAYKYAKKTGFMPSEDQRLKEMQRVEKQIRSRNAHGLQMPDGFYENLVARLEIVITGENKNLTGMAPVLQQFLTLIAQNPAVLQNKATRAIAFKILEFSGMQPAELDLMEQQMTQQQNSPQAQAPQGAPDQGQGAPMKPGAPMPKVSAPGGGNAPTMAGGGGQSKQL